MRISENTTTRAAAYRMAIERWEIDGGRVLGHEYSLGPSRDDPSRSDPEDAGATP